MQRECYLNTTDKYDIYTRQAFMAFAIWAHAEIKFHPLFVEAGSC